MEMIRKWGSLDPYSLALVSSANFFQKAAASNHRCRCAGMLLAAMSLQARARLK
jgi:hypothetical protein